MPARQLHLALKLCLLCLLLPRASQAGPRSIKNIQIVYNSRPRQLLVGNLVYPSDDKPDEAYVAFKPPGAWLPKRAPVPREFARRFHQLYWEKPITWQVDTADQTTSVLPETVSSPNIYIDGNEVIEIGASIKRKYSQVFIHSGFSISNMTPQAEKFPKMDADDRVYEIDYRFKGGSTRGLRVYPIEFDSTNHRFKFITYPDLALYLAGSNEINVYTAPPGSITSWAGSHLAQRHHRLGLTFFSPKNLVALSMKLINREKLSPDERELLEYYKDSQAADLEFRTDVAAQLRVDQEKVSLPPIESRDVTERLTWLNTHLFPDPCEEGTVRLNVKE